MKLLLNGWCCTGWETAKGFSPELWGLLGMWSDICFSRKAQTGQGFESFPILPCKTLRNEFYLQTRGVVCKFLTLITLNRGLVLKIFSGPLFLFSISHLHLEPPFLKRSSILHQGLMLLGARQKSTFSFEKGYYFIFLLKHCHGYSIMSKCVYLLFKTQSFYLWLQSCTLVHSFFHWITLKQ